MENTLLTSPAYTRGPWLTQTYGTYAIQSESGRLLAWLTFGRSEEARANARLIAAAPDLFDACQLALDELHCPDGDDDECSSVVALREAIVKAS